MWVKGTTPEDGGTDYRWWRDWLPRMEGPTTESKLYYKMGHRKNSEGLKEQQVVVERRLVEPEE